MAGVWLRSAGVFRRFSRQHDNLSTSTANTDTSSADDDAADPLASSPPHPRRLQSSHRPSLRKPRSLTKLRSRSAGDPPKKPGKQQRQQQQQPSPPPPVPPLSKELTTPSPPLVRSADSVADRSDGKLRQASPSSSASSSRLVSPANPSASLLPLDGQTPTGSTDELTLDTAEHKPGQEETPIVVLQQASPVEIRSDSIDALASLDSGTGQPISSVTTLAANTPEQISPPEKHPGVTDRSDAAVDAAAADLSSNPHPSNESPSASAPMPGRKIWVKRPGGSATMVPIKDEDLVDDVRDVILAKYRNTLGKTIDAPDMTLILSARQQAGSTQRSERTLGPEENMVGTIDASYPGGQTVDEALIVNVPHKRATPRPSPRVAPYPQYAQYQVDDPRPLENGNDYFPPMPVFIPGPGSEDSRSSHHHHHHHHHQQGAVPANEHGTRSISVLNSGQVPPLPSPSALGRQRHPNRPKFNRQPTSSPTILSHIPPTSAAAAAPVLNTQAHRASVRSRHDSSAPESTHANGGSIAAPLPTPPVPDAAPSNRKGSPPPALTTSGPLVTHQSRASRPKKSRKPTPEKGSKSQSQPSPSSGLTNGVLDGSVPPINVLIVEDNKINMRIYEGFMNRLKVRWQTALNGKIAVDTWRKGGFHLVLMDIQMPVMNGLQATKEIRRLERVNGIGVFSSSAPPTPEEHGSAAANKLKSPGPSSPAPSDRAVSTPPPPGNAADDVLPVEKGGFKSPVIIVALTASSLQSDRHEALAVGCNDFLTKPVDSAWLERKVKEWGCMQALIDFDGWRRWREHAAREGASKDSNAGKSESAAHRRSGGGGGGGGDDKDRHTKSPASSNRNSRSGTASDKLAASKAGANKDEKDRRKRVSLGPVSTSTNLASAPSGSAPAAPQADSSAPPAIAAGS